MLETLIVLVFEVFELFLILEIGLLAQKCLIFQFAVLLDYSFIALIDLHFVSMHYDFDIFQLWVHFAYDTFESIDLIVLCINFTDIGLVRVL